MTVEAGVTVDTVEAKVIVETGVTVDSTHWNDIRDSRS